MSIRRKACIAIIATAFAAFEISLFVGRNTQPTQQEQVLDVLIWGEETQLFDKMFQLFEEKNPEVSLSVSYVAKTAYEDFIQEQISGEKEIADVIFLKPEYDIFLSMVNRGRLLDISDCAWVNKYREQERNIYMVNKKQYAIPFISNQLTACYNTDILSKLDRSIPLDNEETEALLKKATECGISPVIFGGESEDEFYKAYSQWLLMILTIRKQTKSFSEDLQNGRIMADDPVILEYMRLIENLKSDGGISEDYLLINAAEALGKFKNGEAAVIMDDVWSLYQEFGNELGSRFVTGPLFCEMGKIEPVDSLAFLLGIDSKSDNMKHAKEFIGFLSEEIDGSFLNLPEGMELLNDAEYGSFSAEKNYDFDIYMDKCDWWIKEPFEDITARLLAGKSMDSVVKSTELLFKGLTIPTYIYVS